MTQASAVSTLQRPMLSALAVGAGAAMSHYFDLSVASRSRAEDERATTAIAPSADPAMPAPPASTAKRGRPS